MIFWTEDNFCFISDCGNSFNCKLQKLINEQIVIFYSHQMHYLANRQNILSVILSLFYAPLLLGSICKQWVSVYEVTLSKCGNVHYRKNYVLLSFTINSQLKLKKLSTLFCDINQKKLATKFNKRSRWVLWIGDPKAFWIETKRKMK